MSEYHARAEKPIPDRRYFTIGEVSELCGVKDHVLRYWEKKFPMLQPSRRQGRRYYRREDVMLVRRIQELTGSGYTMAGTLNRLRTSYDDVSPDIPKQELEQVAADLERVVELLKD